MARSQLRPVGLVAVALLSSQPAAATEISVDCPALPTNRLEELDARVRLLLRAAPGARRPNVLRVMCDAGGARLVWDPGEPEYVKVGSGGDAVEPILAAIDARLFATESSDDPRSVPAPAPRPPERKESAPQPPPPPLPIRAPAPVRLAPRGREPNASGLALAATLERWSSLSGWGVGPHVEVALGPNPVLLAYAESMRFGAFADRDAVAFDLALGAAYGAPFASEHPLGVFALGGAELFSKFRRESTGIIPFGALGVRGAVPVSRSLRLWLGIEGRLRGETSALDQLQVLWTAGVFLPVQGG